MIPMFDLMMRANSFNALRRAPTTVADWPLAADARVPDAGDYQR